MSEFEVVVPPAELIDVGQLRVDGQNPNSLSSRQFEALKKNILHVMQLLGHKNIKNTLIYTQLITVKDDDFTCKIATIPEQAAQLVEAGFEFVCRIDDKNLFRKRK